MHGFILEIPNSQLRDHRIGIYGLIAEPLKNSILTESQSNMGQECGVTANCTILKIITPFNLLPWSVTWRVMAIIHRQEWRDWRCTSLRRHVMGFQQLQSTVKLHKERTNWFVVYRPELGTQEVREKRSPSGLCSQCLELLAHGNGTYTCVLAQPCLTLYDTMDCSPPGFCVHGIFQAQILEWVDMLSSRGSSQPRDLPSFRGSSHPRDQTCISCISCTGRRILYDWATFKAQWNIWMCLTRPLGHREWNIQSVEGIVRFCWASSNSATSYGKKQLGEKSSIVMTKQCPSGWKGGNPSLCCV